MKNKVLVTYAKQYQLENGAAGTTVQYFFLNDDGSLQRISEDGQQNAKVSLSYEDRKKCVVIPGIYEGSFSMTIGSDRKPVLKLVDLEYLGGVIIKADENSAYSAQHEAFKEADAENAAKAAKGGK